MDGHRHASSVVDFVISDGRPKMRQACGCGAMREIPAWDRTWTPAPDDSADEMERAHDPRRPEAG